MVMNCLTKYYVIGLPKSCKGCIPKISIGYSHNLVRIGFYS